MKNRYLTAGPITPLLISELMTLGNDDAGAGAVSVFIGKVRDDETDSGRVKAIEYSAYEEMVSGEAEEIVRIVRAAFSDVRSVAMKNLRSIWIRTYQVSSTPRRINAVYAKAGIDSINDSAHLLP